MTIDFVGIRAGHGTTTVALAAAALLSHRRPTRISAHEPADLCAIAAIPPGEFPFEIAHQLEAVPDGEQADIVDTGALPPPLGLPGFAIRPAATAGEAPENLRVGVLRGPDYLGLRTLCAHAGEPLSGIIVLAEADRVLDRRDVEAVTGRTVLAEVQLTPRLARSLDAGLFANHASNLRELAELDRWLFATLDAPKEAPCTCIP